MKKLINSTSFLAIVACLLWATAFVGIKIGLVHTTPLQFAGIRFFISGLMIFIVFGKPREFGSEMKQNFGFVFYIAFLQTFLLYALFYYGIDLLPASIAALVIGSGPLFASLVAHFSLPDDRLTWRNTISIIVGFIGIIIINLGRQIDGVGTMTEVLGVAILLLNNMIAGVSNVAIRKRKSNMSPMVLSSGSLMIGGALLFMVSVPIEGFEIKAYPFEYYAALAWLSFLSAAAITIWYTLLRRPGVKVSKLNSWKFIVPVMGATFSWILMDNESPDVYAIVGMLVVVLALFYNNSRFKLKKSK